MTYGVTQNLIVNTIFFSQAEEIVATEEESLGRHMTSSSGAIATTDSDDYDDDDFDSDDEDIDVDVDGDDESVISELVTLNHRSNV